MKLISSILFGLLLVSGNVNAIVINGPTPNTTTLQEYELPSGAPSDVYIWNNDYPGRLSAAGYFWCDKEGVATCKNVNKETLISFPLKERRSGMTHTLTVRGYIQSAYYDPNNPGRGTDCAGKRDIGFGVIWSCGGTTANAVLLTVYIPQAEMNNLPVGGVWEGQFKLRFYPPNLSYVANITLKGKDTGKQDIYFPEFNGANPLVQLDLHPTGSATGNSFAEDVTALDMCLYDGYNSNSDSMTLSFRDEGKAASGRREGNFSIYNTVTNGTNETERIDYRVEMFDPHSKSWRSVQNNSTFTLQAGQNGTDQIRPVRLPSITYPVLCAPAPLRLIVDKFRVSDKLAGYYKGKLHVVFSPSLNSI